MPEVAKLEALYDVVGAVTVVVVEIEDADPRGAGLVCLDCRDDQEIEGAVPSAAGIAGVVRSRGRAEARLPGAQRMQGGGDHASRDPRQGLGKLRAAGVVAVGPGAGEHLLHIPPVVGQRELLEAKRLEALLVEGDAEPLPAFQHQRRLAGGRAERDVAGDRLSLVVKHSHWHSPVDKLFSR